jgi:outer membrane protein TolC
MNRLSVVQLCTVLLVLLPAGSAATLNLDVDTAVQLAIENNLELKSERIDLETAARAQKSTWNQFLPSIDASTSLSRSNEISTFGGQDSSPWNLGFAIKASLPLSAAKIESIRAVALDYQRGLVTYEMAKSELERSVRKAFFSLLVAQESIRLAEQELATAEQRYQQTRVNYESGLVPRLQVLSARVSAENLKPALEEQRVLYTSSLMDFQLLLGLDGKDELTLEGAIVANAYSFDSEELLERYMNNRLDIQSAHKQIEIIENQKQLQKKSSFTPTLSLSASVQPTLNAPFTSSWVDGDAWFDSGAMALAVSVPLDGFIPGSADKLELAALDDSIGKARLSLEQTRKRARIEVQSAVLKLDKSLRSIEALELNVSLAQEAYELTEKAYQAGTVELLEVKNASDDLQKAKLSLLNEKYNYLCGLIDLSYSLNTTLSKLEEQYDR